MLVAIRYDHMYRDLNINIEMLGDDGTPFVCEVQVIWGYIAGRGILPPIELGYRRFDTF